MPDITQMQIPQDSGTTSQTYMKVTSYSLTPSTTSRRTTGSFNVQVTMSQWTWVGTHSSDSSFGRRVRGTINGHDIGTHLIKPHATVAWNKSGVYNYTINVNIPYSPGTVYANIRVERQNGTTGGTACFTPRNNYWTMNSGTGQSPSAVRNTAIAGSTGTTLVGYMSGSRSLTWTAPVSSGTGSIQNYDVYFTTGGGWSRKVRLSSGARSYSIPLGDFSISRGTYLWFVVRAVGLYGSGMTPNAPAVRLSHLPVRPGSVSIASTINYRASTSLSWTSGSHGGSGINRYRIEYRRRARGSTAWSSWTYFTYRTSSPYTITPSSHTAWNVGPGDSIQYRVFTEDNLGLRSSTARDSGILTLRGGIMRVRVSGTWREGIAWVRVSGTWREGIGAYQRVAGSWREGV